MAGGRKVTVDREDGSFIIGDIGAGTGQDLLTEIMSLKDDAVIINMHSIVLVRPATEAEVEVARLRGWA